MNDEKIIYQEHGILVSTTRVVIDGTTYPTANITSVTMRKDVPDQGCAILAILVGFLCAYIGKAQPMEVLLIFGCILLVIGVIWMTSQKPTFSIVFSASSGEIKAMVSNDQALIQEIVEAINQAIIIRG